MQKDEYYQIKNNYIEQTSNFAQKVQPSSGRSPFWDSLKIWLIFIVVYGHMIESCVDSSRFNQAMYNFIYLFHMPLFVFISGRFSHIKDQNKYLFRLLAIFETYFIFQLIRCLKSIFVGGHLSLFPDILIPKGILWYLACLILWRLIIIVSTERFLKQYKWYVLTVFLVSGLGIGFFIIPDGTVIRFFTLGLFFFMGYYSNEQQLRTILQKLSVRCAIILLSSIWLFVFFFLNIDIQSVIYFGSYYDNLPTSPLYYLCARFFMYIFAIIVGYLIMRIVYAKPILSKYGNCTLAIFMYHIFFVMALRPLFANHAIPSNEIFLIGYTICICTILTWIITKFKIATIMLNPISYVLSHYRSK